MNERAGLPSRVPVASALVLVALGLAPQSAPAGEAPKPSPPPVAASQCDSSAAPQIAPDFQRLDLAGRPLRLSDYRGKVVLLSFWATWCEPCLAELPILSHWQDDRGRDGLQVLGISMDDDPAGVVRIVQRFAVSFPVAMGDEQLGILYGGVLGLPLAFVVDRTGRITARCRGEAALSGVESRLDALLPHRPR